MSVSTDSNLSNLKYGCDFVIATTQDSINGALLALLSVLEEPVVKVCFVANPNSKPVQIDYSLLKQKANGSDPFLVPPNANVNTSQDIKNLFSARFLMGFSDYQDLVSSIRYTHPASPSSIPVP
ncbi:hypothetical protein L207DRAFT_573020 [Hyaloscypha variabilis F]|uniref:Uncharacterized protein n=1 Tax=Hyaloscypha variabilis (strain UAMH 11265 / GT02V1 / F) TaxID=1149755 RepID=A0A2J6QYM8_HYAVF|nr:hypothetical protein L207DRAFT_573020 [Hyaloscypha variabilis F]